MTTKQENPRVQHAAPAGAPHDTLRIAYEIHTLAQMVYAKLAARPVASAAIPMMHH